MSQDRLACDFEDARDGRCPMNATAAILVRDTTSKRLGRIHLCSAHIEKLNDVARDAEIVTCTELAEAKS